MGGRHSKTEEVRQPDSDSVPQEASTAPQPSPQPALAKQPSIKRSLSQLEMDSLQPEQLFARFANSTGTEIEPEGLQELCELLEVDPATDVAVLVLAWKCHTQTMGVFTKEEFLRGLRDMQADTLSALQRKIPELRTFASNVQAAPFKEFFRFVFEISREPGFKVLDIDVATALLDLLLGNIFPLAGRFKSFLSTRENLKAISSDQWLSFLEFCKQHSKSLSNYDSDGAWPVLIDEFVAWLQANS